jgi:hypothetical protein
MHLKVTFVRTLSPVLLLLRAYCKVLTGKCSSLFQSNVPNYPAWRVTQSSEKPESYSQIFECATSTRNEISN